MVFADQHRGRDLVVHELVHVYHGQYNPTRDFTGAETVGWFAEGLATYASGQLDRGHRERAEEAVATGQVPTELVNAWSGPYRYGVCGSIVEYIDRTYGRDALVELLAVTSEEELLGVLDTTAGSLLGAWRASVESRS